MIQRYRFQPPSRTRRGETVRQEIVSPIGGINDSIPPWNLSQGQSPYAVNFRVDKDRLSLAKRGGMRRYGTLHADLTPGTFSANTATHLLAGESADGIYPLYMILSDTSIMYYMVDTPFDRVWYRLNAAPSAPQTMFRRAIPVLEASSGSVWNVLTSGQSAVPDALTAYWNGSTSTGFFKGVFSFLSHESYAKYGEAFNERLLFFNTSISTATEYPKRVRWSVKGNPFDFSSYGAGFQDLADMRGEGTGILADRDRLLLWSTQDVWMGRARNDDFGFDFFPVNKTKGCDLPHTLVNTDVGPIWATTNGKIWWLNGTEVIEIGREIKSLIKEDGVDHFAVASRLYATFDPKFREYKLHFLNFNSTNAAEASAVLVLRTDSLQADGRGIWQHFYYDENGVGLTHGAQGVYVTRRQSVNAKVPMKESSSVFVDENPDTGAQGVYTSKWRSQALRSRDANSKEAIAEAWVDGRGALALVATKEASSNATLYTSPTRSFGITSLDTTLYFPLAPVASRHPQIEVISTDGTSLQIHSIRLTLRAYSGRF